MDYYNNYYFDSEGSMHEVQTTDAEGYSTQPYIWRGEDKIYLNESDITPFNWSDAGD